jgi:hypothetical protein
MMALIMTLYACQAFPKFYVVVIRAYTNGSRV